MVPCLHHKISSIQLLKNINLFVEVQWNGCLTRHSWIQQLQVLGNDGTCKSLFLLKVTFLLLKSFFYCSFIVTICTDHVDNNKLSYWLMYDNIRIVTIYRYYKKYYSFCQQKERKVLQSWFSIPAREFVSWVKVPIVLYISLQCQINLSATSTLKSSITITSNICA